MSAMRDGVTAGAATQIVFSSHWHFRVKLHDYEVRRSVSSKTMTFLVSGTMYMETRVFRIDICTLSAIEY